jgi:hypothetical protein
MIAAHRDQFQTFSDKKTVYRTLFEKCSQISAFGSHTSLFENKSQNFFVLQIDVANGNFFSR